MEVIENNHLKTERTEQGLSILGLSAVWHLGLGTLNFFKFCPRVRSRNSKLLQVLPSFLKSACVPYQLGSIFANPNTSLPNCDRNPQVRCNVPKTSITVDVHQFINHSWVDRQSQTSNGAIGFGEAWLMDWFWSWYQNLTWHKSKLMPHQNRRT